MKVMAAKQLATRFSKRLPNLQKVRTAKLCNNTVSKSQLPQCIKRNRHNKAHHCRPQKAHHAKVIKPL